MKADLFDYPLPRELIAAHPTQARDGARLLVLRKTGIEHRLVRELPELLPPGSLVVVNDTRVRRARLLGHRLPGGGNVELFFLRELLPRTPDGRERWEALGRANKPLRSGTRIVAEGVEFEVLGRDADGLLELAAATREPLEEVLERVGRVPIPPYLNRDDEPSDVERYQTVYARRTGSVAAPTAGLHLTPRLLDEIRERGSHIEPVELEVGLGTFRPVTADDLDQHTMHAERVRVPAALARSVSEARRRSANVVAIGTTVVRALESAADPERPGLLREFDAETRLLVQPGYRFRVVDSLFTNFHQPRSTLLALVAAFTGRQRMLDTYAEAVRQNYRFLSYGDAMWIPERIEDAES